MGRDRVCFTAHLSSRTLLLMTGVISFCSDCDTDWVIWVTWRERVQMG